MQSPDILPDGIVELQFAPFTQFHQAGSREGLRLRGEAKAVACRQLFAGVEIGLAEGVLGHDLAPMHDSDDASRLLRSLHLKFEPVGNVVERGSQPWFHVTDPPRYELPRQATKKRPILADKTKPAQPERIAPVFCSRGRSQ